MTKSIETLVLCSTAGKDGVVASKGVKCEKTKVDEKHLVPEALSPAAWLTAGKDGSLFCRKLVLPNSATITKADLSIASDSVPNMNIAGKEIKGLKGDGVTVTSIPLDVFKNSKPHMIADLGDRGFKEWNLSLSVKNGRVAYKLDIEYSLELPDDSEYLAFVMTQG